MKIRMSKEDAVSFATEHPFNLWHGGWSKQKGLYYSCGGMGLELLSDLCMIFYCRILCQEDVKSAFEAFM